MSGVLGRPSQEVLVGKEIWFRGAQETRSRAAREGQCPARVSGLLVKGMLECCELPRGSK